MSETPSAPTEHRPAGVFLRGIAMGSADIVPGVSGGTVAFITGIYEELIDSLRSFDLAAIRLLLAADLPGLWRHVHAPFLLSLLAGIAVAILTLAKTISYAMAVYPLPVSGLFFGLILASALLLHRELGPGSRKWLYMLLGVVLALALNELRPPEIPVNPLTLFCAGALAICAMILPGISGSFILLMLGMYQPVLDAVHELDVLSLAAFMLGCGCGLLLFVRLLSWLLQHYRRALLAALTGVLLGSLSVLWPWKLTADGGVTVFASTADTQLVWPWQYADTATPQYPATLAALLLAVMFVLLLDRLARRRAQNG